MKVLVTGANGQVGHLLAKKLSEMPEVELLSVDKNKLDIVDSQAVTETVSGFKPDVIINAAAYTAVDKAEAEHDVAYAINCLGPKNLAEAAEKYGALLIHISTDYVFPGDKEDAYLESDTTGPTSVYGQTKLDGENAVMQACPRHIIIRTAWVFGEHGNNFVKTMLRLAETHSQLRIVSDQIGGPTYAGDIADSIIKIAHSVIREDKTDYGIYHYAGLPHVSWSEFAEAIFSKAIEYGVIQQLPIVNRIMTSEYPTPAHRPANSKLDTQRITQCYGITASDWKQALNSIKAYKS
ncbi:dTDP-4-dehydrorhamnose reductase [Enterobacter sp. RHBSTW-00994]|uniref:dTDP-4-dehydrorhamnose reductase n=1 Tax=Enterobacter sp. RHBSTW-00994 TaxID=2742676 RepID=UPI0015E9E59A|nr:dTDP-4-dehydrorhamnose reductase [Enterobacter sp. RHBSTW-00994]QLR43851.1 dTDP-4-dehydrorhamnose reductase [Enterobacter sp. RHBSTW-00994]